MGGSVADRICGGGEDANRLVGEGEDLARRGDHEAATARFRAALEKDPKWARALNGLGFCRHAMGDLAGAVDAFVAALRSEPDNLDALANLGDVTWQHRLPHRVAPLARMLLEQRPGDPVALGRLQALGIVASSLPVAVIVGGGVSTEDRDERVVDTLVDGGYLVRVGWPDIQALLETDEAGGPRSALDRLVRGAGPDLLVVVAGAEEDEIDARAIADRHGIAVVLPGVDGTLDLPEVTPSSSMPRETVEPLVTLVVDRADPRRRLLDDIGWLVDEQFEPGNSEDLDLCLRMLEAGWESVVAQSIWIHHKGSQTFTKLGLEELLAENHRRLLAKYGSGRLARLGSEVEGGL